MTSLAAAFTLFRHLVSSSRAIRKRIRASSNACSSSGIEREGEEVVAVDLLLSSFEVYLLASTMASYAS